MSEPPSTGHAASSCRRLNRRPPLPPLLPLGPTPRSARMDAGHWRSYHFGSCCAVGTDPRLATLSRRTSGPEGANQRRFRGAKATTPVPKRLRQHTTAMQIASRTQEGDPIGSHVSQAATRCCAHMRDGLALPPSAQTTATHHVASQDITRSDTCATSLLQCRGRGAARQATGRSAIVRASVWLLQMLPNLRGTQGGGVTRMFDCIVAVPTAG